MGITQKTYSEYLGKPATVEMIRAMPREHALAIYRTHYWLDANIDRLPEVLQPVVFDMSVNMGPGTAVRLFQRALSNLGCSLICDGRIGPVTAGIAETAVADLGGKRVINTICDLRREYYTDIVTRDRSQFVFFGGWLNRCESYRTLVG